jgi:hypothetical protein
MGTNELHPHFVVVMVATSYIQHMYHFMNCLNHYLMAVNLLLLGLMNLELYHTLKMGCTILVDNGWPTCLIFGGKETIFQLGRFLKFKHVLFWIFFGCPTFCSLNVIFF